MYHIVCHFPHFTETTLNVTSKHRELKVLPVPVMWSETVGLRTRPVSVSDQKIGLGLAGLMLCCETRSCHARRHNDLEEHSNFSSTIYSFSILWLNITTVEINSGVHLLKS